MTNCMHACKLYGTLYVHGVHFSLAMDEFVACRHDVGTEMDRLGIK